MIAAHERLEVRVKVLEEALRALLGEGWEYVDGEWATCNHCGARTPHGKDVEAIKHSDGCPVTNARRALSLEAKP